MLLYDITFMYCFSSLSLDVEEFLEVVNIVFIKCSMTTGAFDKGDMAQDSSSEVKDDSTSSSNKIEILRMTEDMFYLEK